jgi:hypothetical protein
MRRILEEGGSDERKESGRSGPRSDRHSDRGGERFDRGGRAPRDAVRPVDLEEEREIDLTAAISHFEEIAAEPVIEIAPDDEDTEPVEERRGSRDVSRSTRPDSAGSAGSIE